MRNARRSRQSAEINVTPLVDVLLIVLVIVMLAMPAFVKRLAVELPVTNLAGAPVAASTLRVTLLQDGAVMLDDKPLERERLLQKVRGSSVEIATDKATRYEVLALLLAQLQEGGAREVSLLTF